MISRTKRAVYVGPLRNNPPCPHLSWLHYGMTGETFTAPGRRWFSPDGGLHEWGVGPHDVYVPSEHKTRHCPKP